MKPWDRQGGESTKSYHGFRVYLDLGPTRTLAKAWTAYRHDQDRPETGPLQSYFKHWSSRYDWVQRAKDYDHHLQQLDFDERKAQARARAIDIIDMEWRLAEAISQKAFDLLQQPLSNVRFSMRDVALLVETASRLARRSAGVSADADILRTKTEAEVRPFGITIIPPAGSLVEDCDDLTDLE